MKRVPEAARCQGWTKPIAFYGFESRRCPYAAKVFADGMRLCMVHFRASRDGRLRLAPESLAEQFPGEFYA